MNDAEAAADQSDPAADPTNFDPFAIPNNDISESLRGSQGNVAIEPLRSALPSEAAVPGGPDVDVPINAVIVSGARTPWEAIGKAPGVRNVVVTGGIIALGENPLAKPPAGVTVGSAKNPPAWLKFKPDLRLLNGSVFPPVVPNVIDIRIISFTEQVIEK